MRTFQNPLIVMGMAQCGTTLLAEMAHRGGTLMFAGDFDPSYDDGIKYERPSCQAINRQLLGVCKEGRNPVSIVPMWDWPLKPFPRHEIEPLQEEVGDSPWGFKDPRTTLTYRGWLEAFPEGPRLYTYRAHADYLRRWLRVRGKFNPWRARRQMRAWLAYNEAVVRNCSWDAAAGRLWALLYYDELMEDADLIPRTEAKIGVPLFDARNPDQRRTRPAGTQRTLPPRERLYVLCGEAGHRAQLRRIYGALEAMRLRHGN